MQVTSIVILTYNNLNYTQLCIDSIRRVTRPGTYEIVVVDNASTDGTVAWLKAQSDLKLICNDTNRGFPAGCNQGIRAAGSKNDILLLNNDTIVTEGWLDNLQACLASDDAIGAVGPVTNSCSNLQAVEAEYNGLDGLDGFARGINRSDASKWEERVRLIGFCMLIRRKAADRVGLLDEDFGKGNFEDDDYSLRLRRAGYRLMVCSDCFIHHFGSASFGKDRAGFNGAMEKSREKFTKKWGVDPLLFSIDQRALVEPFLGRIKPEAKILVVNSGCGALLFYLKKKLPSCRLTAAEANGALSAGLAGAAEVFDGVRRVAGRKFDLIILLADWHVMRDVEAQADYLPALLENGGSVLLVSESGAQALAARACYQSFRRSLSKGAALLRSPSPVTVTRTAGDALAARDYSLSHDIPKADRLSFLLRRVENGIDRDQSTDEIGRLLAKDGTMTQETVEKAVARSVIDRAEGFNTVGAALFNMGDRQRALEMFIKSNAADVHYRDGAFNLAYLLLLAGEKQLALKVIERCGASDDEMEQLRRAALA